MANNITTFLSQQQQVDPKSLTLLDWAAGYGRVTRWLAPLFKTVAMTDLEQDMIDFQSQNFGVRGFKDPQLDNEKFDVVFVFSLFTHLPLRTWREYIELTSNKLNKGGYLIFSTHSYELFAQLEPNTWKNPSSWKDEFFFRNSGNETLGRLDNNDYGITIVKYSFVEKIIKSFAGLSLVEHFKMGKFDKYHDIL